MPIRAENRDRYPRDWKAIRAAILARAGNRCEGSPLWPDCRADNHRPHPATGARVVLTIAHLDHTPENCAADNLRAWCQRCHNAYDAAMRAAGIRARARKTSALRDLFDGRTDA
jgi:5-methylcytosine-specific restriction endonuclease McrA